MLVTIVQIALLVAAIAAVFSCLLAALVIFSVYRAFNEKGLVPSIFPPVKKKEHLTAVQRAKKNIEARGGVNE